MGGVYREITHLGRIHGEKQEELTTKCIYITGIGTYGGWCLFYWKHWKFIRHTSREVYKPTGTYQ